MTGCSSSSDDEPQGDDSSQSPDQSPEESAEGSKNGSDGASGGGSDGQAGGNSGTGNSADGSSGGADALPKVARKDVPAEVATETEEATDDFLDSVNSELEEPDAKKKIETLPGVTGAALEELRNRIDEYDAAGWRVLGEPVVVRQRVVRMSKDSDRAVVHACIDNSDVRVLDPDGKVVPNSRPTNPRTRNILTLAKQKGSWVVTDQRPATKPDC